LKKNKIITLEEILTKLKTKYKDVDLSLMHVHRIVKDNNITLKITRIRLKANIGNVLRTIPEKNYENIFKGAYKRPEKYVAKNKTRKKPLKTYL